ncbi:hypothetical protein FQN57_006459 [Myotisia sp. PD_48]|nr:hypothetical protein FQN57_006459 [Myotisia sp. PD_48]
MSADTEDAKKPVASYRLFPQYGIKHAKTVYFELSNTGSGKHKIIKYEVCFRAFMLLVDECVEDVSDGNRPRYFKGGDRHSDIGK